MDKQSQPYPVITMVFKYFKSGFDLAVIFEDSSVILRLFQIRHIGADDVLRSCCTAQGKYKCQEAGYRCGCSDNVRSIPRAVPGLDTEASWHCVISMSVIVRNT